MCRQILLSLYFISEVKGAFHNLHCKNGVLDPIGIRTTKEWQEIKRLSRSQRENRGDFADGGR